MSRTETDRGLSLLDRALYALFARHADGTKHATARRRYRATDLKTSFDVFLSRLYGLSWLLASSACVLVVGFLLAVPERTLWGADAILLRIANVQPFTAVSRGSLAVGLATAVGLSMKAATIRAGGLYLRWLATARRNDIERTLPGAVRYLHSLSSGSDDPREMLRRTARNDAYGESAVAFRKTLNTAELTGSLDAGLRRVARDTPSRELLAPFLLKFREHAMQGEDALESYLHMESRMLSHRQERARTRASGYLELLAELFVVMLVLPALFVIVLTVMSVLAPGLAEPVATPFGPTSLRALAVYGSAVFILLVGLVAVLVVESVRPEDQYTRYVRPQGVIPTLRTAGTNPASAAVVFLPPAVGVGLAASNAGVGTLNAFLAGYVSYALPVGVLALRRARLDDAKDREIRDFVHAVSGHVSLGRPFPEAVRTVSREVDLGPLDDDVADLGFNLGLTSAPEGESDRRIGKEETLDGRPDRRTAALDRFVERVGTPLGEQTVGLVTGALDAGSDTETVFENLQSEIGRLYHEKRSLRSAMLVYAVVGWTTAVLIVGIVVAVNQYIVDGFTQLSATPGTAGFALDPATIDPERDAFRFYVVTQATMLASGWFAGIASRNRYEALLHSGVLVLVCYLVFAGVGAL
ncbi:MAG: type II secretion system F family protein [Haloferacaceae archaeon]